MLNGLRRLAVTASTVALLAAGPAAAETLQEAIALAYATNPTLLAQRASQRALDESVPQARSNLRPTLSISASGNYTRAYDRDNESEPTPGIDIDGDGDFEIPPTDGSDGVSESDSSSVGISLSQNLYTGGRVAHGINIAEANVLAGRENLRDIEQQVLQTVIQVYVDVMRDMEILRIRQENVGVLRRQLEESNARFEVGEITRTDVAQSEARLAQSEADLSVAQAQLSVSRAAYAAVVGQAPTGLERPPELPGLPENFEAALDVGLDQNPSLRSAEYIQQAAEAAVAQARAEYLPSARLTASYGSSSGADGILDIDLRDRNALSANSSISVPLFTGGLNQSRVAQALERANAAQIGVEGERRGVLQGVSSAYAQLLSTRSTLVASEEAVRAARIAAEGVRQEAQVGLRTTLDVLNQELELRTAEVTLVSAQRNLYLAQALLLSAMGRLEGPNLVPSIEAYDPRANYERVRHRGALPTDAIFESLDRIAAPPILPADDQVDAPIDQQLKSEVIDTAPRE